jgi:hypothetical protein
MTSFDYEGGRSGLPSATATAAAAGAREAGGGGGAPVVGVHILHGTRGAR